MFQVKATVVGFLGDEKQYPCHFQHKVGDEFIYDGEKYIGRICPHMAPVVIARMMPLCAAGPRITNMGYYYPFWYAPVSVSDPDLKKYDGLGFRNVFKTIKEDKYHMRNLQPPELGNWPPATERTVGRSVGVVCGDTRTSMMMKVEAFDLSDKGDATPYFRRQMTILHKVMAKPGIAVEKILGEFTRDEIEIPYPALHPLLVSILSEELELMGYLEIKDGKASVTGKGKEKLAKFKKGLSAEEKEALDMKS
ncbi:MAG: hypothetical protein A2Z05_08660 [Chloroflexi bacterium RBG_16_60_22]|nr:MAG: hypothetical protein A2Z05_08660 [Chloroflexi bacterium RBG_16_60_22]